ncbi:MAG: GNAT family N-acetyltransferase [Candidatus Lokiarchaeota archaeon]|nr:GNAT family N-acetyltransferase [Candidatus Lokiarchaeota archaeon]
MLSVDLEKLAIEPAKSADINQLTEIMTCAYEDLSSHYLNKKLGPPGYNQVHAHMDWLIRGKYYKIVYDNLIIGGCILEYYQDLLFIGFLFIDIPYQGKGIGTYTLKYIESLKASLVEANTPEWAIRNQEFYIKNGYMQIDSSYDDILGFRLFFYQKQIVSKL